MHLSFGKWRIFSFLSIHGRKSLQRVSKHKTKTKRNLETCWPRHKRCLCSLYISGIKHPASKVIYVKIVDLVEKWDRFIQFALLKVTVPSFVLPKYIFCFYMYFSTNMGNDAFELPLPLWWVDVFVFCLKKNGISDFFQKISLKIEIGFLIILHAKYSIGSLSIGNIQVDFYCPL